MDRTLMTVGAKRRWHAPGQLSLPGFDVLPAPVARLFFAIFPDTDAAVRIAKLAEHLRDELGLKGDPHAMERFHITWVYLGDYAGVPPRVVDAAVAAASSVPLPSFEVRLDRAASFAGRKGNRPLVLCGGDGVVELTATRDLLCAALTKAGVGGDVGAHYTPHVTLLYDRRGIAEQPIDPIGWTVREFVLVHSHVGRKRYVPLARFPLAPKI